MTADLSTILSSVNSEHVEDECTDDNSYREVVLLRIEKAIENVVRSLSCGSSPTLVVANTGIWNNVRFQETEGLHLVDKPVLKTISFDSMNSVKKLALLLKVLSLIYIHVQNNTYCTKRDLYYQDPVLFGSQDSLDSLIDDAALIIQVPRSQLHVLATSKGLVAGDLQFIDADGNVLDCSTHSAGTAIPANVTALSNLKTSAKFLLVVEKDASFQHILGSNFIEAMGPCIVATGKGFPDVSTRLLMRRLWNEFKLPMFALVDADPHGLEIMAVYAFGSRSMCYDVSNLTVPSLRWLGVLPSDIDKMHIPQAALIPMTTTDINKAKELLERPYICAQPHWKDEIELMLKMGVKAEIQCLYTIGHNFLTNVYLPNKLQYCGWI